VFWRLTPLLGVLLLSACGFEPVYAVRDTGGDAADPSKLDTRAALAGTKVQVRSSNQRQAQILQIALEDALYPGKRDYAPQLYSLTVIPQIREWPAVILSNQFIARTDMRITVLATLEDSATGKQLWNGRVARQSSFNAEQADYATFVAREDAIKRGMEAVAADLVMQLQARVSAGLQDNNFGSDRGTGDQNLLPQITDDNGMQITAPTY
jgi:hypothetical protein